MPELPSHSDSQSDGETIAATSRWKIYLGAAVLVLAIAVFVGLHVTGVVGPSATH
jgi:hypothetical protein